MRTHPGWTKLVCEDCHALLTLETHDQLDFMLALCSGCGVSYITDIPKKKNERPVVREKRPAITVSASPLYYPGQYQHTSCTYQSYDNKKEEEIFPKSFLSRFRVK